MNIPILGIATLMLLATLAHLFIGSRETLSLDPGAQDAKRSANWVQAVCAWQLLSVDLLIVTGVLFVIGLTDVIPHERILTRGLSAYFAIWAVVWLVQMLWLRRTGVFALPHWIGFAIAAAVLFLAA